MSYRLCKFKDDRGLMAELRSFLVKQHRPRAYPALSRIGIEVDDTSSAFVAALFAMHPDDISVGNFGYTCLNIEKVCSAGGEQITPTERRLMALINTTGEDLYHRIYQIVRMAKSKGISINYEQLNKDLKYWGDNTRREWSKSFWNRSMVIV